MLKLVEAQSQRIQGLLSSGNDNTTLGPARLTYKWLMRANQQVQDLLLYRLTYKWLMRANQQVQDLLLYRLTYKWLMRANQQVQDLLLYRLTYKWLMRANQQVQDLLLYRLTYKWLMRANQQVQDLQLYRLTYKRLMRANQQVQDLQFYRLTYKWLMRANQQVQDLQFYRLTYKWLMRANQQKGSSMTEGLQALFRCKAGYTPVVGTCIRLSVRKTSYDVARKVCMNDGGTLAMPKTRGLDVALRNLIKTVGLKQDYWIGMKKYVHARHWQWEDGRALGNYKFKSRSVFKYILVDDENQKTTRKSPPKFENTGTQRSEILPPGRVGRESAGPFPTGTARALKRSNGQVWPGVLRSRGRLAPAANRPVRAVSDTPLAREALYRHPARSGREESQGANQGRRGVWLSLAERLSLTRDVDATYDTLYTPKTKRQNHFHTQGAWCPGEPDNQGSLQAAKLCVQYWAADKEPLSIAGVPLTEVHVVKLLGMYVQADLGTQVNNIVKKGSQRLFMLRKLTQFNLSRTELLTCYKTFVRPTRDEPGSSLDPARDLTAARPNCKSRSTPYRKPHGSRRETDRAPDSRRTLGVMTPAGVYTEDMPNRRRFKCDLSITQYI
ncbi:hypothetical protein Bbelb_290210 [Branchiostoma belcheri]|nr:hypothetical protein Bbelb_290210 [Branchiostoma belcheri]